MEIFIYNYVDAIVFFLNVISDKLISILRALNNYANLVMALMTFLAILVALFAEKFWKFLDNKKKKENISELLVNSLQTFKNNLSDVTVKVSGLSFDELLNSTKKIGNRFSIGSNLSSELNGFYFLFTDMILKNLDLFPLSRYSKTVEFFIEYRIEMDKIQKVLDGGYHTTNQPNANISSTAIVKLNTLVNNAISELSNVK